ncbi:MAG: DMT family transporter [Desulfobacteraceae bacterium]|nr:DMT family transporter [Desulfobacteraceae bacterium]
MNRIYIALTVILWASAYVAIRISLKGYSPFELALFRYIIASITMGILAPIVGIRIPDRKDLFYIILTGIANSSWRFPKLSKKEHLTKRSQLNDHNKTSY